MATLSLRARHTATKLRLVAVPSTKMASGVVNATMYVIHLATISWKTKKNCKSPLKFLVSLVSLNLYSDERCTVLSVPFVAWIIKFSPCGHLFPSRSCK